MAAKARHEEIEKKREDFMKKVEEYKSMKPEID